MNLTSPSIILKNLIQYKTYTILLFHQLKLKQYLEHNFRTDIRTFNNFYTFNNSNKFNKYFCTKKCFFSNLLIQ